MIGVRVRVGEGVIGVRVRERVIGITVRVRERVIGILRRRFNGESGFEDSAKMFVLLSIVNAWIKFGAFSRTNATAIDCPPPSLLTPTIAPIPPSSRPPSRTSPPPQSSDMATCYQRTCKAHALEIRVGAHTVSCPRKKHATTVSVEGYHGHIVCPPYAGLEDARCRPTCSNNDPECLGIKGSVVDEPKPHSKRKKKTDHDNNNKVQNLFNTNNHDKPVVVHGRLRRG